MCRFLVFFFCGFDHHHHKQTQTPPNQTNQTQHNQHANQQQESGRLHEWGKERGSEKREGAKREQGQGGH